MPQIVVTTRAGEKQTLAAEPGRTAMEVIRDGGIAEIEAICGGSCACATCHVYVNPEFLDRLAPVSEDEQLLLEGSEHYRAGSSRLSCQIRLSAALDGLALTIAPEG